MTTPDLSGFQGGGREAAGPGVPIGGTGRGGVQSSLGAVGKTVNSLTASLTGGLGKAVAQSATLRANIEATAKAAARMGGIGGAHAGGRSGGNNNAGSPTFGTPPGGGWGGGGAEAGGAPAGGGHRSLRDRIGGMGQSVQNRAPNFGGNGAAIGTMVAGYAAHTAIAATDRANSNMIQRDITTTRMGMSGSRRGGNVTQHHNRIQQGVQDNMYAAFGTQDAWGAMATLESAGLGINMGDTGKNSSISVLQRQISGLTNLSPGSTATQNAQAVAGLNSAQATNAMRGLGINSRSKEDGSLDVQKTADALKSTFGVAGKTQQEVAFMLREGGSLSGNIRGIAGGNAESERALRDYMLQSQDEKGNAVKIDLQDESDTGKYAPRSTHAESQKMMAQERTAIDVQEGLIKSYQATNKVVEQFHDVMETLIQPGSPLHKLANTGAGVSTGAGAVLGWLPGFAAGGVIPGNHNNDTVKIRATPGEVVVPKHKVNQHGGADKLMQKLGFSGRGKGDGDRYAKGGAVEGGGYENGRLPDSALATIIGGGKLRPDAAAAWNRLVTETGKRISITSSYRDYDAQVRVRREKGNMAAVPGRSNHGWGLALDLGSGVNRFGTEMHNWMRANAPKYGWNHPSWAQQGGSKPEAWHWEYTGGAAGGSGPLPVNDKPAAVESGKQTTGTGGAIAELAQATGANVLSLGSGAAMGLTNFILSLGGVGPGSGSTEKAQSAQAAKVAGGSTAGAAAGDAAGGTAGASDKNANVGIGKRLAAGYNWGDGKEWDALYKLFQKESGWNHQADNPASSAYGIPQALISLHKMPPGYYAKKHGSGASARGEGGDPAVQIKWGLDYIRGRYGSPTKAWEYHQKNNSYSKGSMYTEDGGTTHAGEMVIPAQHAEKIRTVMRGGKRSDLVGSTAPSEVGADPGMSKGGGGSNVTINVTVAGKEGDAIAFARTVKRLIQQDDYDMSVGST